jgi:hypothetical protein
MNLYAQSGQRAVATLALVMNLTTKRRMVAPVTESIPDFSFSLQPPHYRYAYNHPTDLFELAFFRLFSLDARVCEGDAKHALLCWKMF